MPEDEDHADMTRSHGLTMRDIGRHTYVRSYRAIDGTMGRRPSFFFHPFSRYVGTKFDSTWLIARANIPLLVLELPEA
jgi:hypothetical protein